MPIRYGTGQDGDTTISANTDLGSTNTKQYNNLTIQGPTWVEGISSGTGWQADGTDDYVNVPTDALLSAGSFTIAFWAKKYDSEPANNAIVINKMNAGLTAGYRVKFDSTAPRKIFFSIVNNAGTEFKTDSLATSLSVGTWRFFAFTFDGSTITAYENGISLGTVAFTGTFAGGTEPLRFAADSAGANFGKVILDSIRYWDVVKTPAKILDIFAGFDDQTNLRGLWKFEQNTDDSGPNNFDGTLNGQTSVELKANSIFSLFVKEKLDLHGTLSTNADKAGGTAGTGGGGVGGTGAGVLLLQAKIIRGFGTINLIGGNGGNGSPSTSASPTAGGSGADAAIDDIVVAGASGGATGDGTRVGGTAGAIISLDTILKRFRTFATMAHSEVVRTNTGSGAGGGGAKQATAGAQSVGGGGGGGGGSFGISGGAGGNGGNTVTSTAANDAGGGGAGAGGNGGIAFIITETARNITVTLTGGNGGNGGNATTRGGGGGGGGSGAGGIPFIISRVHPKSINVEAGTAGTGGTGITGTNGAAGTAGQRGTKLLLDIGGS